MRFGTAGHCRLVDEAVVVCGLNLEASSTRDVLLAQRSLRHPVPVFVETTEYQADRHRDTFAGTRRIQFPCTRAALVDAVGAAVARR